MSRGVRTLLTKGFGVDKPLPRISEGDVADHAASRHAETRALLIAAGGTPIRWAFGGTRASRKNLRPLKVS